MTRPPTALFVAEGLALDQFTGRLTAFNILDSIFAPALPARLPRIHVVGIYELQAQASELLAQVEILSPGGTAVSEPTSIHVQFGARTVGLPPVSHTTIHTFWNIAFREEGDHRVRLRQRSDAGQEWVVVQELALTVVLARHPLAQEPSNAGKPQEE